MVSDCFSSGRASLIVFGQNLVEDGLQVMRQGRLEFHFASVFRVMKGKPSRVQERPLEGEYGTQIARHASSKAAVHRIADNRMADRAQMDANLMGSPGRDRHVNKRHAGHL